MDEAHHCKNPQTKLWQLINSLQRRFMFLLTATPVQNNLVELYNLLTLLEPGHLQTEKEFKRQFVKRGNPRDPRNRQRLRELLGEVMIRNTRSLVQIDLPPRYAADDPGGARIGRAAAARGSESISAAARAAAVRLRAPRGPSAATRQVPADRGLSRLQVRSILAALGSHPTAVAGTLEKLAATDPEAARLQQLAEQIARSAKDERLLELLRDSHGHKVLVFVHALRTLHRLQDLLTGDRNSLCPLLGRTVAGGKGRRRRAASVNDVPVMLCTDSGGEGHNLQFADTLINYDLPWNPMRIEQRIGRVHRYGQTRDVFVFNLCTENSLESRILGLLNDKIRMFELVVGEIGSILGNLEEGDEFESVVLQLWMKAGDERQLEQAFTSLATHCSTPNPNTSSRRNSTKRCSVRILNERDSRGIATAGLRAANDRTDRRNPRLAGRSPAGRAWCPSRWPTAWGRPRSRSPSPCRDWNAACHWTWAANSSTRRPAP